MPSRTSILVIGGGPAGSVAAALLAQAGFQVTLVEKHMEPRYHIGESLLPGVMEIFRLIGVKEQVDAYGFVRKEGGFFDWGGEQ
jgi:flavin-dependent dehydrogenase